MQKAALHHIAIMSKNLEKSARFYCDILGFEQMERPPFDVGGLWLASGGGQVHVVQYDGGSFRDTASVDTNDIHFALRVENFAAALDTLIAHGYSEDAADGDPMRLVVKRKSIAGFPQLYMLDPDFNIVEINAVA